MISAGSQAFAVVVRRVGTPAIAARLKVTRGAVHNWSTGRKTPTAAPRRGIAKHYDVAVELWDAAPGLDEVPRPLGKSSPEPRARSDSGTRDERTRSGENSPPSSTRTPPKGSKKGKSSPGDDHRTDRIDENDPVAVCRDTIRTLRKELDRLNGDKLATSKERAQLSSALTQATRLLARLTGSIEISQSQILRSPHWKKLVEGLVGALRPVPGACAAAATYFRGLDG